MAIKEIYYIEISRESTKNSPKSFPDFNVQNYLFCGLWIGRNQMNTKRLIWWLLAGSRGGVNRARIILTLHDMPSNANQLAEHLNLDYKTIRHHLDILEKNDAIVPQGDGYGTVYFVSDDIEANFDDFRQIWVKIGEKGIKGKDKE